MSKLPTASGLMVSFAVATLESVSTFNVTAEPLARTPAADAAISAIGGARGPDPLFGVRFPGPLAVDTVQSWNCEVVNIAAEEGLVVVTRVSSSATDFSVSATWQ